MHRCCVQIPCFCIHESIYQLHSAPQKHKIKRKCTKPFLNKKTNFSSLSYACSATCIFICSKRWHFITHCASRNLVRRVRRLFSQSTGRMFGMIYQTSFQRTETFSSRNPTANNSFCNLLLRWFRAKKKNLVFYVNGGLILN